MGLESGEGRWAGGRVMLEDCARSPWWSSVLVRQRNILASSEHKSPWLSLHLSWDARVILVVVVVVEET